MKNVEFKNVKLEQLRPAPYNPRIELTEEDEEYQKLKKSITEFGYVEPIVFNKQTGYIIGGHQRIKVLKDLGYEEVLCTIVDLEPDKEKALNIGLNKIQGDWNFEKLKELLEEISENDIDLDLTGFDEEEISELLENNAAEDFDEYAEEQKKEEARQTLAERFIMPPFSVLDTRRGEWQRRKRAWQTIGIRSHLGRGSGDDFTEQGLLLAVSSQSPAVYEHKNKIEKEEGRKLKWDEYAKLFPEQIKQSGTSIFDPVLTEICYRWFAPKNGNILDPFAGGSVRGVVAGYLGYKYLGIDLRKEQVKENEQQAEEIELKEKPRWKHGDSQNIVELTKDEEKADLIFSCPPYYDLEVYSDDENDISNSESYNEFLQTYTNIIKESVKQLKENRFAVFVVGEIRDKKGFYRNFVSDTIKAFEEAGAHFYNETILINTIGSLAIRINRQFSKGRKIGKAHQNVLVFYKGEYIPAEEAAQAINENFKGKREQKEKYEKALVFYKGNPKEIVEALDIFEMGEDELAQFIESEFEEEVMTDYGEEL